MTVVKAYFGDRLVFRAPEDIGEHVKWLLPDKDADVEGGRTDVEAVEEEAPSIEEIVR